ncbi:MAG: N-6 DNA methylase [Bacteroidota bacterium]
MKEYRQFVDELNRLINGYSKTAESNWKKDAAKYVNGLASERLRNLVPLSNRRACGAFFTMDELASRVLQAHQLKFEKKAIFYDPACGAGNLLIAVRNYYAASSKKLNIQVRGTDIHEEFINATNLRLRIWELYERGKVVDYSSNVAVCDGMKDNTFYQLATHVVVNPPFNQMDSPVNLQWASGKVSAAAVFVDAIIENIRPGTQIVAILPDVLRSGSRYHKWREHISAACTIDTVNLLGQFDKHADVDVFSILLTKKKSGSPADLSKWNNAVTAQTVISDLFNVTVGPVVDNRDLHTGVLRPYIVSKGLQNWIEIGDRLQTRQHSGKAIESPFVVIKRTSRHGDGHRALGTLINIPEPVYVDNHLIILKPLSGLLQDCQQLLDVLQRQSTNQWIDEQIRCRHLTVNVIKNIPVI